jgi:hypothetical protein
MRLGGRARRGRQTSEDMALSVVCNDGEISVLRLEDVSCLDLGTPRGCWCLEWKEFHPLRRRTFDLFSGSVRPTKRNPIRFQITSGKNPCDFMAGSFSPVITERLVQLLKKERITGWKPYPVEVYDQKGQQVSEQFHGFSITGRGGPQDVTRGVESVFTEDDGTKKPMRMSALYFDLNNWDGSDLFIIDDSYWLLATPRAIEVFESAKVTGWKPKKLTEVKV